MVFPAGPTSLNGLVEFISTHGPLTVVAVCSVPWSQMTVMPELSPKAMLSLPGTFGGTGITVVSALPDATPAFLSGQLDDTALAWVVGIDEGRVELSPDREILDVRRVDGRTVIGCGDFLAVDVEPELRAIGTEGNMLP